MWPEPPANAELAETMFGRMAVPDAPQDLIGRSLVTHGEWAGVEIALAQLALRPADTVYDVGAYLGTFSLGAAAAGVARIVAVEPSPEIVPLLRFNLSRNCPISYAVVAAAVGTQNGRAAIADTPADNLGGRSWRPLDPGEGGDGDAAILSLPSLRRAHGDYSVLKLDVEGAERAALLGDAEWIAATRPLLWIECNETPRALDLLATLQDLGLEVVYAAWLAFYDDNFLGCLEHPYPIACEAALVAGSRERLAPLLARRPDDVAMIKPVRSAADLREAMWRTPRSGAPAWRAMSRLELYGVLQRANLGQRGETFLRADAGAEQA